MDTAYRNKWWILTAVSLALFMLWLYVLGLLRGHLLTQPVEEMPPGQEVHELSEVLPYAIVLGGADRWLDGLAATDRDDNPDETELDWYHGPEGWHLADLPDSLRNFITTVEGSLLQR